MSHAYPDPLSIEQDHPTRSLSDDQVDALVRHVIDAEGASLVHVSIVLTDHATVRRLNQSYLDHDYNTDVLSFSLQEDPPDAPEQADAVEGEVYVDLDTAAERHEEFGTSFEREALRYVAHGVLHLLGYDDATSDGRSAMKAREDQSLNAVLSEPTAS